MGALDDGSGSCRRNEAWISCSSCINAVPDRVGESYRTSVPSPADLWASPSAVQLFQKRFRLRLRIGTLPIGSCTFNG
jgi:hypothetical protein